MNVLHFRPGSVLADFEVTYVLPTSDYHTAIKILLGDSAFSNERDPRGTIEQAFYDSLQDHVDSKLRDNSSYIYETLRKYGIEKGDVEIRSLGELADTIN